MKEMTPRERMLTAMRNQIPDRIPAAPDMSNMIPCRLTGKPFWDIYLYQDPPLWQAYIEAVKYFGFDGWMSALDGYYIPDPTVDAPVQDDVHYETVIVERTEKRIVTRAYSQQKGCVSREWAPHVIVYPRYDPPTILLASKVSLEAPPEKWEPIEGVKQHKQGFDQLRDALARFDNLGVIGAWVGPPQLGNPEMQMGYSIYDYCDKYDEVKQWSIDAAKSTADHLKRILAGPVLPDFILTGGSGMLVFNTPDIVREITLPALMEITRLCKKAGIPSQIHCCGPERELVKMCAFETDLSNINPLEIRPMGDCDLTEIKQSFGDKLSLMGNLHTTEVMLYGSVKDVRRESLKAIRAAGENGGFILSTGDQCGRDTPDANIYEMVNVCKEFGVYPLDFGAIDKEIANLEE